MWWATNLLAKASSCSNHSQVTTPTGRIPLTWSSSRTDRPTTTEPSELTLRIGTISNRPIVQITRGVQLHLLELLGIEFTQNRCGSPEPNVALIEGLLAAAPGHLSCSTSCWLALSERRWS
jgi:hypothetical protein